MRMPCLAFPCTNPENTWKCQYPAGRWGRGGHVFFLLICIFSVYLLKNIHHVHSEKQQFPFKRSLPVQGAEVRGSGWVRSDLRARFTLSLLARAPRRLSHTYSPRTLFPPWSGWGRGPFREFRMMACFCSPLTSSTWKDIKWQEMEKAALLRDAGQLCANSSPLAVTLGPQKVRAPSPLNPTGPPPPGFPCSFTGETHCDFLSRGFPRPAHPLLPGRVWATTPLGAPRTFFPTGLLTSSLS